MLPACICYQGVREISECAPEPATPANGRLPKIWPAGVAGGYTGDIASASRQAFFICLYGIIICAIAQVRAFLLIK